MDRKKKSFFNEFNQGGANGNTKWQILSFSNNLQHYFSEICSVTMRENQCVFCSKDTAGWINIYDPEFSDLNVFIFFFFYINWIFQYTLKW